MRLTIPLTGTVLVEGSVWGKGELSGDPNDPIRPIAINLGNVSWRMVDIDLDNEVMIIEVEPGEKVSEPTGEVDDEGNPIYKVRPATDKEKQTFLQYAQGLVMNHTKNELYQMSGCSRLKRPFKGKKGGVIDEKV